ncbi:2-oxoglutarate dehydrogenase E1 component [Formicincola oecophyllae]|uniref:2-oxoglutarate dehydrogenase E1 component n=1 Tax=Formicincola oecophyllae TaxID=2558361 RepID=A0A4Y6U9S6_9PROT|nr:2-oxoglutarate dehydrogenase E1 component [Formicincola oecophyllae]QDH13318.1 2-oxoglutarate dehydrogenase E1 component [Formicincola oecophyllae]
MTSDRTDHLLFPALEALGASNGAWLEEKWSAWLEKPESVAPELASLFSTLNAGPTPLLNPSQQLAHGDDGRDEALGVLREAWRQRGHLRATLDPLGLRERPDVPGLFPPSNAPAHHQAEAQRLEQLYAGTLAVEYMHLQDARERQWWQDRFEGQPRHTGSAPGLDPRRILALLTKAEIFEAFCQQRYTGARRFGLEGGESLVVALQTLVDEAGRDGVDSMSFGMSHRGRLNVMVNILHKPAEAIFSEFAGKAFGPDEIDTAGDVKYHLGCAATVRTPGADGKAASHEMRLALLPNPSHLEAVDPVVMGRVRADQDRTHDEARNKHLGVLVHGDGAFAGQGVVYETLQLSRLRGYGTGGTVHIVLNNQVSFTTDPTDQHSGVWNTDVARTVQAPVLHVNGAAPEAVARAASLAHEWRQAFGRDIVINLFCYRLHGHNETDEPAFTQPRMVEAINAYPGVRARFAEDLEKRGLIEPGQAEALRRADDQALEEAFAQADTYQPDGTDWLDASPLDPTRLQDSPERVQPMTGVPLARLREVGLGSTEVPAGFALHPRIERQFKARRQALEAPEGTVDWATAETLALGTIALDGHRVRLSGQDSGRGTFSQRHAVLTDQRDGHKVTPLDLLSRRQGKVEVWNSPLSEYGVMGFEYGYSLGNPEALVMWEAQFGDFANGAQVMIDQFVASGETKWLRTSSLTLLLPHGLEGAGPEHSSARPERFLALCADNNMRVCMPSTPANYFHLLRRQIARRCKKPAVIFTPKSLLRRPEARSLLAEMGPQTRFQPILPDPLFQGVGQQDARGKVRRLILCAGKVYYDLAARRAELGLNDVALVRLEQFYPFPHHALVAELVRFPKLETALWCQEEPRNGGAWRYVDRRYEHSLKNAGQQLRPRLVGRRASASPATGLASRHASEQAALIERALTRDFSIPLTPDEKAHH